MDKIFINGFVLFARHGVQPEEAVLGQRFIFDVELGLDLRPAGQSDQLDKTVDYGAIMACIQRVTETRRCRLLESLGEAIVQELLAAFPLLQAVRLRINKPSAPVPGMFDSLGIEVVRER
jgi:dihydroneopterin aldolase